MNNPQQSRDAIYSLIPGFQGLKPPREKKFKMALSRVGRFATEGHSPEHVVVNNMIVMFRLAKLHRQIRGNKKFAKFLASDWGYALDAMPRQSVMMNYMYVSWLAFRD